MKTAILIITFIILLVNVSAKDLKQQEVTKERVRISIGGGAGYLTGSSREARNKLESLGFNEVDAANYYKKYKFSVPFNGSLHYLYNSDNGIGFTYKFYSTESEINDIVDVGDNIHSAFLQLKEKVYVNFVGISWLYYLPFLKNERFNLFTSYAFGLVNYRNEAISDSFPVLVTGNTPGLNGNLGGELFVKRDWALSAEVSYLYGVIKNITLNTGKSELVQKLEKGNYENVSQISLSLGLKIYF